MPVFSIGLALIWVFGFQYRWQPIGGRADLLLSFDGLRHALVPAVTLASGTGL